MYRYGQFNNHSYHYSQGISRGGRAGGGGREKGRREGAGVRREGGRGRREAEEGGEAGGERSGGGKVGRPRPPLCDPFGDFTSCLSALLTLKGKRWAPLFRVGRLAHGHAFTKMQV